MSMQATGRRTSKLLNDKERIKQLEAEVLRLKLKFNDFYVFITTGKSTQTSDPPVFDKEEL